ncbi:hypothetical protein LINPERPRIM_LOCUS15040 [Linum perenne]
MALYSDLFPKRQRGESFAITKATQLLLLQLTLVVVPLLKSSFALLMLAL